MNIEKELFVRKGLNFILGLGANFAVLYATSRMHVDYHKSLLLFTSGIMSYALLADFGFGRPIYVKLRKCYLNKSFCYEDIYRFSLLYILVATIILLITSCASLYLHALAWQVPSIFLPALMALGLTNLILIALYRDLHEAVNNNNWFEGIDGSRRLLIILASLLGALFHTLWWYAVSMAVFSSLLTVLCTTKYLRYRPTHFIFRTKDFWTKQQHIRQNIRGTAMHNFLFRMGEIGIYNWGFLFYSGNHGLRALVAFSVWQRIFIGLSTPSRILQDSAVPSFTEQWFKTGYEVNFRGLIAKSFFLTTFVCISFACVGRFVVLELTRGQNIEVSLLIGACLVWSFANILQHLAGTYLLSINQQVGRLCSTTLLFLAIGAACVITAQQILGRDLMYRPELLLLCLGGLYVMYALSQFRSLLKTVSTTKVI